MAATGLDKRIALVILSRVGAETRHVIIGSIVVGFVMAFLVPSTTARVACLVPITAGLSLAFSGFANTALALVASAMAWHGEHLCAAIA